MTQGSNLAIWAGAGAIASALHLLLVQQGLAAYSARSLVPPPVMPQVEIMAVASSVAGEEQPVETVAAVQSQRVQASSAAERSEKVTPQDRLAANAAAPARVGAVASAVAVRPVSVAPKPVPAAPQPPAAKPAAIAPAPEMVSAAPMRPVAPTVSTVTSAASVVAPVPSKAPGLNAPTIAPVAIGPTTSVAAARVAAPAVAAPPAAAVRVLPEASEAQPSRPDAPKASTVASLAPVVSTVQPLAPVGAPVSEAVPSLPPPPEQAAQEGIAAPQPDQTPQENVQTYKSVLDVLAEMPKAPCFAALPSLSDQSEFQLEVFAQTPTELQAFATALEAKIGQPPNTTMKPISAAQCAAAAFVIDGPAYPRFNLFFEIAEREIKSGEALEGRIGNTSGGFISFLVIDDEGTVQDLAGYLQFVPGGAQFRIPLSLTGSPVVTQQLLMAVSSPSLLQTVIDMNGAKAAEFFPALAAELRSKGQSEDVALVAFSVE